MLLPAVAALQKNTGWITRVPLVARLGELLTEPPPPACDTPAPQRATVVPFQLTLSRAIINLYCMAVAPDDA